MKKWCINLKEIRATCSFRLKKARFLEREVTGAAFGWGAHDEVIEELNLHSGGGQAHRAGQAAIRVTGGGISTRMVVYENEGVRGVNEGGFENFARMRKRFVDRTLRKFFKLD